MVEADGQWHTSDNKYGSADWKAAHPLAPKLSSPSKSLPPLKQSPSCPPVDAKDNRQPNGKGKAPSHEIFVLDSDDDEDEGRVKRELSPSYASSANRSFEGTLPAVSQSLSRADTSVIDLTLDESDEDDEPLPTVYGKRRAADAELDDSSGTDQIWKKGRVDPSSRILPTPRGPGTVTPVLHSSSVNNHQPASPHHYGSFSNNTLPLPTPYSQFTARNGSSSSSLHLPPLSSNYLPRQSQNTRWPA
jgi:E3 SUMO-protein ligase PIAS1